MAVLGIVVRHSSGRDEISIDEKSWRHHPVEMAYRSNPGAHETKILVVHNFHEYQETEIGAIKIVDKYRD